MGRKESFVLQITKHNKCIKAMYIHPLPSLKVNHNIINWFTICSGVGQEDSMSPTLFGLFINDLITEAHARYFKICSESV